MTFDIDMVSIAAMATALSTVLWRFIDKNRCERELADARRTLGHLQRTFTTLLLLAPEPKASQIQSLLERMDREAGVTT